MPVEAKPLFRPDVLRPHVEAFALPPHVEHFRPQLDHWAELIRTERLDNFRESEILPDFLTDFFVTLLDYRGPASEGTRYTLSRERHVEIDGKFADAVLGDFNGQHRFTVAVEGKGPRDPLDRAYAGRRMSAVDQGYRYAINLPCDWIIVTSTRQTRLYHKGSDQHTYERFDTYRLWEDEATLRRFIFLLGAPRVVPVGGRCHLHDLLAESEKVGRQVTKDYYVQYANMRQDAFEQLSRDNTDVPRPQLLASTQKLLDRVLFMAFAEDRGLLPADTIERAFKHRDPYNPKPVWDNFSGLFRHINAGSAALGIHAYNGGLFADDPALDRLTVSDQVCEYFHDLGKYDYRSAGRAVASADDRGQLIDVDILGHIFEQSISDLEKLRNELEGRAEPVGADKHKTRRKKEGAFYTPAFITRYIIEQALGGVVRERFDQLRRRLESAARGAARAALADPAVYELDGLAKGPRAALVEFWEAWQDELATLRILDPACGSGAFLVEAFDQLHAIYQHSNDRLHELRGHRSLFDLDKRILENNLYGVDLNDEAIEICRLSLWIKTAERGKALTSLDHTIRVGNSVVDDPSVHPKAFDWRAAFPEVFRQGGFDVVVGNPPYIRHEMLTEYKPYWETRFQDVFAGTADIYTYFYALGCELLRAKGRLAFISSSGFARAGFAKRLRRFLRDETDLEQFIDLGDTQVFSDAKDVTPAIVVFAKPQSNQGPCNRNIRTVRLRKSDDASQFNEIIKSAAWEIPASQLDAEGWQFERPHIISLRKKLLASGESLKEYVANRFLVGIKTALNEAFVVDSEKRNRLIDSSQQSASVLKPFVGGQDLRRWYHEDSGNWLVIFPSGWTSQACGSNSEAVAWEWLKNEYPSISGHLLPFEGRARKRLDKGQFWWELRPCDYYDAFDQPKIMYPDIAKTYRFHMDRGGLFSSNTTYFFPIEDWYLLGVLNSKATWFSFSGISTPFGERAGEFRFRFFSQYVGNIPIPKCDSKTRGEIGQLAMSCNDLAPSRHAIEEHVRHRLIATFGTGSDGAVLGKLNQKAQAWWEQTPRALGAALKTSFKLAGNPFLSPRVADEWEPYLAEKCAEVERLGRELADAEGEINERVFRLFNLTREEIALLKKEVEH